MKPLYTLIFCLLAITALAQKRPLDHPDFDTWKQIEDESISNNGQYVAWSRVPGDGDATLKISTHSGEELATVPRGVDAAFTDDSKFLVFTIKPAQDSVNALRRKKVKKEDLPKDSLGVYNLESRSLTKIPQVNRFELPEEWSGYVAFLKEKDSTTLKESHHLVLLNLETGEEETFTNVTRFTLAEEGESLLFSTKGLEGDTLDGVYFYDFESLKPLCRGQGTYKQLALDEDGERAAFVADRDTTNAQIRNFQLRVWTGKEDSARMVAARGTAGIPDNWLVSEHGSLVFSDDTDRLFFGTSPQPMVQDTTLLDEEVIEVEIWNYQDNRLYPHQEAEMKEDQEKSYRAVLNLDNMNITQLATPEIPDVQLSDDADEDVALAYSGLPYQQTVSWEGFPPYHDIYSLDINTGQATLLAEKVKGYPRVSAEGNYLYWFNVVDQAWYAWSDENREIINISANIGTPMGDELNDRPDYDNDYGMAGWTEDDEHVLIYDRYDIWKVDPDGKDSPQNLTNGRADQLVHRYIDLDRDEEEINPDFMLLYQFNEETKQSGYASLKKLKNKEQLVFGPWRYNYPLKAADADALIYTRESHQVFPDLRASDLDFESSTRLSNANPEQENYLWSTVELVNWTSLDGTELDGLLYKPENFDPDKEYPLMVYFYERRSDGLYRHTGVVPFRSTVNPTFYASRGYVVFIPDIVYEIGYPGESCFNAMIPGITSLVDQGFIDKENIGVQGHSWGGYQISYLVTRTNLFAAANCGAPVVNMFSAYGGIRWGSGLSRMFQYEHTQSRIGGTIWEKPLRYLENSPLFFADKIETPLMFMHNDEDTAVPWYQGIEFFTALRRLGKPAWMLNYNGEPHNPIKWENKRDFNIRMQQFFDHYLKEDPMPEWMQYGVPAKEKGMNPGYELVETDQDKK